MNRTKSAQERDFKVSSATVLHDGRLEGNFDLDTNIGTYKQDIKHFQDKAKEDKAFQEYHGHRKDGYRKVATIPDSLAMKIMEDHGLNIHDVNFMNNPANLTKLKRVLMTEYRDLVINT